ncbi:MAG TPA: hypothetical protein VK906_15745 [Egicoccus sp.]|nr:hypothetical protein [Egicoccus sp.]HSK24639.1 hypothetical protein [Egicoccus sp.]
MRTTTVTAALAALLLGLAGCGGAAPAEPDLPTSDAGADPSAGMCAPGVTDCVDVVVDPDGDEFDGETERETAAAMLGLAEDELAPDVRIARRGDEQMALTEDYVLGRKTVELDDDGDGTFRVVGVVVELPEGPETITP